MKLMMRPVPNEVSRSNKQQSICCALRTPSLSLFASINTDGVNDRQSCKVGVECGLLVQ